MRLRINGEDRELALDAPTVAGLLGTLSLPAAKVAVELNGRVVKRAEHGEQPVQSGDTLEIVTLVGGG